MPKLPKLKGYKKLERVWHSLLKELPKEYQNLNLFFASHNSQGYELRKGAWADNDYVVIGEDVVKKNDEYIFVSILAHELGHHVLGHMFHYDDTNSCNEFDAD